MAGPTTGPTGGGTTGTGTGGTGTGGTGTGTGGTTTTLSTSGHLRNFTAADFAACNS